MSSQIRIKPQGESTLYGGQIGQECYIYIYGFLSFHLGFRKTQKMDFDTRHLTQFLLTCKREQF